MNGVHDLGGMHGFGPVVVEPDEPIFHAEWEKRAFGLLFATMAKGMFNLDQFRHGIERMDPVHYLSSSYYEHWLGTYECCLVENGILAREELEARVRHFLSEPDAMKRLPRREDPAFKEALLQLVAEGYSTHREVSAPPKFKVGDHVVTVNIHPAGHTRLPRYARGKRGVIERWHGAFVFPDTNAHGLGESPQHCYTVRFDAEEIWGRSAGKGDTIYLDLWEPYLEAAVPQGG